MDAYVQLQADETGSQNTVLTLSGEAVDSSTSFTTSTFDVTARTTTAASVSWSVPAWIAGEQGLNQRTPNLSAIIQEIVSRPGWNAGGALSLIATGSGQRAAESIDGNGTAP